MSYKLSLTGKTFGIKDHLKADGFKWNAVNKTWTKIYPTYVDASTYMSDDWAIEGVISNVVEVADFDDRKYIVKSGWIFNLEAMHDKLWCISYDIEEGKLSLPITIAGTTINSIDDLFELKHEAEQLEWTAKSRRVNGKEYSRIKELVSWRVNQRYAACLNAGMPESQAGLCFEDL